MNTHIAFLTATFSFILVTSCHNQLKENENFKYTITIDSIKDSISLDSLIESIDYIQLATSDEYRIGDIEGLIVYKGNYYIVSNELYCFDEQGAFKYKIQKGHSQKEFIEISSINIDNGQLCLYDRFKQMLLLYDANTGQYINNYKIPFDCIRAFKLNNWLIKDRVHFNSENINSSRICVTSTNNTNNCEQEYFQSEELRWDINSTETMVNDGLLFSSFFRNKCWKISAPNCYPYFKIALPAKYLIKEEDINNAKEKGNIIIESTDCIYGLNSVQENSDFISGLLMQNKKYVYFHYNKKTGTNRCFREISNNLPWRLAPAMFMASENDAFYNAISSDYIHLIKMIKGVGTAPNSSELFHNYQTYVDNQECDNPIIVKYKLKQ